MVQRAEEESTEADIQDEATFEDVDTEAEQEPVKDGKTAAAEASDSEEADLSEEGPEG
jgi:hypothetical protein